MALQSATLLRFSSSGDQCSKDRVSFLNYVHLKIVSELPSSGNTLVVTGVEARDENGDLLAGVSGDSGSSYAIIVIPEPSSVLLVACSGLILFLRRRGDQASPIGNRALFEPAFLHHRNVIRHLIWLPRNEFFVTASSSYGVRPRVLSSFGRLTQRKKLRMM